MRSALIRISRAASAITRTRRLPSIRCCVRHATPRRRPSMPACGAVSIVIASTRGSRAPIARARAVMRPSLPHSTSPRAPPRWDIRSAPGATSRTRSARPRSQRVPRAIATGRCSRRRLTRSVRCATHSTTTRQSRAPPVTRRSSCTRRDRPASVSGAIPCIRRRSWRAVQRRSRAPRATPPSTTRQRSVSTVMSRITENRRTTRRPVVSATPIEPTPPPAAVTQRADSAIRPTARGRSPALRCARGVTRTTRVRPPAPAMRTAPRVTPTRPTLPRRRHSPARPVTARRRRPRRPAINAATDATSRTIRSTRRRRARPVTPTRPRSATESPWPVRAAIARTAPADRPRSPRARAVT